MTIQRSASALSLDAQAVRRSVGGTVFAMGLVAIAAQTFIVSDFVTELQPVPAGIAGRTLLAYVNAAAVLVAVAGILANYRVRLFALMLTCVLFIWIALLHAPRVAAHLAIGAAWTPALEILAMAGGALMLTRLSGHDRSLSPQWNARLDGAARLGLICFGITLPAFGALHFIYNEYVANVIPAWIPGHLFWAYFTGVAHIAAGLAIITSLMTGYVRLARLAAALFALMAGTWVVILHLPRALAAMNSRPEWTSMFVAMALCGAGLLALETLSKERKV